MAEYKDMQSSSPARTPKMLSNHRQENVGYHLKKDTPCPGARRSPNKMVEGAKTNLESNVTPARDDAVKVLHSICQQIWKLSNGHKTGKGQFSFQSQRKAMPKNVQTTTQLHSSTR